MAQKALSTEKVQELRSLRSEGLSVRAVATRAGVSEGAVSNYTRDIAKPARRTQSRKEGPKSRNESKDTTGPVVAGPYDEETKELANQVKKARLQSELDEIEDRKRQRQEIEDLRIRERKLMLQLDTSRGDGAGGEMSQLRQDISELRESRHQAELRDAEYRHQAEIRRLEQLIAASDRTGLTPYDLMARWGDKIENLLILGSGKIDKAVSRFQSGSSLRTALQLGISPAELEVLTDGPGEVPTREDWEVGRRLRAHHKGVALTEPEPGEYEGLVSLIERRNRQYETALARVNQTMVQGGYRTGSPGKTPAPGQAEPAVLKAESRLVTCSRCGTTFDIDLGEARQAGAAGKRLFVNCANPKCNFLLDLTELLPELKPAKVTKPVTECAPAADKSTTPKCYVAGHMGRCDSGLRNTEPCRGCWWL